jgi:FHS family L-fucose permease-like MFS transporter
MQPSTAGAQPTSATQQTYTAALAMVTTLFFMWGFTTALNDILIPHLKSIFDLNYAEAMLVQFSFFSAYFVFSWPAGQIVNSIGYKGTMIAGLLTMAVGALLFIAAASVASFPVFLTALIIVAAGMTALQVSANPYVAVLGPERTASSRLNLAQAFNSLGTTVAPYLGSLVILSAAPMALEQLRRLSAPDLQAYRLHEAATVKAPYLVIGLVLIALAVALQIFKLPRMSSEHHAPGEQTSSVWKHSQLVLAAIGIFTYVGAEVAIGSFLVNYFSQRDIGGMTQQQAARLVSLYWGCAMAGRFVGSAILQKVKTATLLAIAAAVACILVLSSMATFGYVAVGTIILVGLFNSIMFPSIFTLGIEGLGPLTGKGSGVLIAAIVGGAIIPELEGILADRIGIHHAFILPAICYVYIFSFALICLRKTQRALPSAVPVEPVP